MRNKINTKENIWANPPEIHRIDSWQIPSPERFNLSNGIEVDAVHKPGLEFFRIDIVFHAGRIFELEKLMGKAVASLLKEGSISINSEEIDEKVDLYGSSFNTRSGMDFSRIRILGMKKFFKQMCELVAQILDSPQFANSDIENLVRRNKERLRVDLVNAEVVAYRTITEQLFGANHPYGYNSSPEIYDQIERSSIVSHYERCYQAQNAHIFISTHLNDEVYNILDDCFGQNIKRGSDRISDMYEEPQNQAAGRTEIILNHPHQSMIQIGRRLFNRQHPDFYKIYMLNTILGGYFGSRLMKNIRENKGLTYNISSTLDSMMLDGYMTIGTEVSHQNIDEVLDAIHFEISKLQQDLVPEKELEMVRNYLMGYSLNLLDGPFNIMDIIRLLTMQDNSLKSYDIMMDTIQHITPEEIQLMAQRYLRPEDLTTVIVN